MNVEDIARIIEENIDYCNSMCLAKLITKEINDEWYFHRKDVCEFVIEE